MSRFVAVCRGLSRYVARASLATPAYNSARLPTQRTQKLDPYWRYSRDSHVSDNFSEGPDSRTARFGNIEEIFQTPRQPVARLRQLPPSSSSSHKASPRTMKLFPDTPQKHSLPALAETPVSDVSSCLEDEVPVAQVRTAILATASHAGDLCRHLDSPEALTTSLVHLLLSLLHISSLLSIRLESAIRRKMELNRRKYPVEFCKGSAKKYTAYSHVTGITRTEGQSTLDASGENEAVSGAALDLDTLTRDLREFAAERDWTRFHRPRSLGLALMGEVGELAELLQFHGDAESMALSAELVDKMAQEVADVAIYAIRLADVCGVSESVALRLADGADTDL